LYDLSGEKDIARRIRDIQQLDELGAVIAHFSSPDGSFTSLMLDTSGQIIRAYDAVKENSVARDRLHKVENAAKSSSALRRRNRMRRKRQLLIWGIAWSLVGVAALILLQVLADHIGAGWTKFF
jgi:hypothetical protein